MEKAKMWSPMPFSTRGKIFKLDRDFVKQSISLVKF